MRATHILSFVSESSKSLSDFLNSLTGPSWDLYIKEMRKYVVGRRSAGTSFLVFNEDQIQPIGQVWTFKVKDFDSFTSSCASSRTRGMAHSPSAGVTLVSQQHR